MAMARKCDRCGKFYEDYIPENKDNPKYINGLSTVSINKERKFYNVDLVDLCEDCLKEFADWVNKDPEYRYVRTFDKTEDKKKEE